MDSNITTEIIINASKERVWGILTNFPNYPNWNPFIIKIEGKLAVNGRLINTMVNGKKRYVFKPKILKVIPFQSFEWLGSLFVKGIFDGHHFFEIEEITPGKAKFHQGENFSGLLAKPLLRKIGDDTR